MKELHTSHCHSVACDGGTERPFEASKLGFIYLSFVQYELSAKFGRLRTVIDDSAAWPQAL
jgi:hypothetical protein